MAESESRSLPLPLAVAGTVVGAAARVTSRLTGEVVDVTGRAVARSARALVAAEPGIGTLRLSHDSLELVRRQVASGLRTLMALPEDTAERLRTADPATMAQVVLAMVGGEEALLPLPSAEEQVRARFRALLDPTRPDVDALGPALLTITAQLSPDEARILRLLDEAGQAQVIDVVAGGRVGRSGAAVDEHLTVVVERAGGAHPELASQYVGNLLRLGLCTLEPGGTATAETEQIHATRRHAAAVAGVRTQGGRPRDRRRQLRLSALGRQLVEVALRTAPEAPATVPELEADRDRAIA